MPTKRMLIDATHPEETRVVVLNGNRLEDFDVEVESRRQLKGNIYLAKVTRVEPSLQAAFIEYGGNRHGFLAFSEIHPDYYQIPVADRAALMAEQEAASRAMEAASEAVDKGENGEHPVETLGGGDEEEVVQHRPLPSRKVYKIQEVIKRRQVLLVQVVKEERGNKGAALTTYLSLAGRYCVLMPNTARGGGISRKIANGTDRKRLKKIVGDLDIPEEMAVIVRTAGAERTKAEIKRDYEYLVRLWDQVRETTLSSTAPNLVYEEGNLIKRSIRDLYSRDIDEIVVAGDEGYRIAKDFMKLLIPSHAKKVQPYRDEAMPLLQRFQVESQLDAMHSPIVQLRSGGYIVINPTEALVAIDVNSGRATRERNIEETAYKTNIEAAEEIARQLRLRDLAGLIVIDFIDMENTRNQIQVERRIKDAMRIDRARIQIGRISPFGLLELSRQRLRPSLVETSSEPCPHCAGTGIRRSTDSAALVVLRGIEEEGMRRRSSEILVHVPDNIILYILNQKRAALREIEARYEFVVQFAQDDTLIPPNFRVDRVKTQIPPKAVEADLAGAVDAAAAPAPEAEADLETDTEEDSSETRATDGGAEGDKRKRRRRPRRRKRSEGETDAGLDGAETARDQEDEDEEREGGESAEATSPGVGNDEEDEDEDKAARRRRRGRRGGRRRRRSDEDDGLSSAPSAPATPEEAEVTRPGDDAPLPWLVEDDERDRETSSAIEEIATAGPSPETEVQPEVEPESLDAESGPSISGAEAELPAVEEDRPDVSRTVVIRVGEQEGEAEAPRRRGWWRKG